MPLLIVFILVFPMFAFLVGVHPYMTITRRVPANLLLVEGRLSESELCDAANEFRRGDYELIVTTGGPMDVNASPEPESYAERARQGIIECGIRDSSIQIVAASFVSNDQSAEIARAFRRWLDDSDVAVTGINVFTSGIHGRRSRTLYRRVLGDRVRVGVISAQETRYMPAIWFLSRTAIRKVVRNTGGYLYYRLFLQASP